MAAESSTLVAFLAILLLLPLLATAGFRVCEDSKQQQVAGAGRRETQMVYNPLHREYFAVYILYDGEHTSVMGQRFDERGSRVGNSTPIFPWSNDQPISRNTKQFPVVAYNNVSDHYLVAWEFDYFGDGKDWDVVANVVAGNGTPITGGPFFLASSYGREDSPHLAFSPKDNTYVLVYEAEVGTQSALRGIIAQRLNETHALDKQITLSTAYADREPFVAYHPPSNDFLLVWEFDPANDNKSVIGAVLLGGTPLVARNATPNIVGSTVEKIGGQVTVAHDHDAQLAYSPQDDVFLLTWEVDGDSGEKEVVCSLVTPYAGATNKFKVVGNASHPFDRKPAPVYTPFTNEFFIAYESGPNKVYTGIEGVSFSANNLEQRAAPFAVSQQLLLEHSPTAALSSTCGAIFTLWASDTSLPSRSAPAPPATKKEPVASFVQSNNNRNDEERGGPIAFRVTHNNVLRSKFSLGKRAPANEEAVPHVRLLANLPAKDNSNVAAEEVPPSTSSLQAILVCLPGRDACSVAASPTPIPSPAKDGDESSVMGVVLGLLGAVVVLAGLGIGGYVGWRRYPQIREWLESRRAGAAATGVWADESEFSISADAFTGSGEEDTAGDDEH